MRQKDRKPCDIFSSLVTGPWRSVKLPQWWEGWARQAMLQGKKRGSNSPPASLTFCLDALCSYVTGLHSLIVFLVTLLQINICKIHLKRNNTVNIHCPLKRVGQRDWWICVQWLKVNENNFSTYPLLVFPFNIAVVAVVAKTALVTWRRLMAWLLYGAKK